MSYKPYSNAIHFREVIPQVLTRYEHVLSGINLAAEHNEVLKIQNGKVKYPGI
jgi:hypothetical protein